MKKVLIVDDAIFMRASLKLMLTNNGFQVIGEAENGINGIKKFKDLNPDLVTMDITMPEMDGIEAIKEIKKFAPNAKIVVVSAMGQEHHVREAILSGASGFIVKPFNQEVVLSTLNKIK